MSSGSAFTPSPVIRRVAVAALEGVFDLTHGAAHLRAARLVDDGASSNLARRLLGGTCVGHDLNCPSAVTVRLLVMSKRAGRSTALSTLLELFGCL